MADETLNIIIRQKGARVVARDIAKMGIAADSSASAIARMQKAVRGSGRGVQQLQRNSKAAAGAVRGLGAAARGLSAGFTTAGLGATILGGAIVKGITQPLINAVKVAAEFEQSINFAAVLANVQRGSAAFERLSETALEFGRTTQFTAREVAGGLQFLAKAGFEADEAISAIPNTLNIAAASGLGLARAADITTNILKGFKQTTDDLPRSVDILAATFTSSNVSLEQLAASFIAVAPIAAQFGQRFEDVAAVVGKLGDAGIQAEKAGIALRRIFINLEKDANKTNSVLRELGITVRDSDGNFRPLIDIFEDISKSSATSAQKIDLFAARALAASGVLADASAAGLNDFAEGLTKQVGRGAEVAAARLAGAQGAFTRLTSAVEGLQIAITSSGLLKFLEGAADAMTEVVRAAALLPGPVKTAIGAFFALAAAAGVVTLQVGIMRFALGQLGFTGAGAFSKAMLAARGAVLSFSAALLTNPIGLIVVALAAATAAAIIFKDEEIKLGGKTVTVTNLMKEAWSSALEAIEFGLNETLKSMGGFGEALQGFSIEVDEITFTDFVKNLAIAMISAARIVFAFVKRVIGAIKELALDFGRLGVAIGLAIATGIKTGSVEAAGETFANTFKSGVLASFDGFGEEIADLLVDTALIPNRLASGFEDPTAQAFIDRAAARGAPVADAAGDAKKTGGSSGKRGKSGGGEVALAPADILARRDALFSLQAALDPAFAATLDFVEAQETLNLALQASLINEEQHTIALERLAQDGYQQVLAQTEPLVALQRQENALLAELAVRAQQAGISEEMLADKKALVVAQTEKARIRMTDFQNTLGFTESFTTGATIAFQDFADSVGTNTEIIAGGMQKGMQLASDAFSEFIQTGEVDFKAFAAGMLTLIQDIITQLLIMLAVKAAAKFVGGGSAPTPSKHGAQIGPGRVGDPFIVGEEGPELFVPSTAGRVVPNAVTGAGGGGGGPPVVNVQVVNVDDAKSIPDAMSTREGEQVIMNTIQRNRGALREII